MQDFHSKAKETLNSGGIAAENLTIGKISLMEFEKWLFYGVEPPKFGISGNRGLITLHGQFLAEIRDKSEKAVITLATAIDDHLRHIRCLYNDIRVLSNGFDADLWKSLIVYMASNELLPYSYPPPTALTHSKALQAIQIKGLGLISDLNRLDREYSALLASIRQNKVIPYAFDTMLSDANVMFHTNKGKSDISLKAFAVLYLAFKMAKDKEYKEKNPVIWKILPAA